MYRCVYVTSVKKIINELTAATVSISNTFVQYLQAFAFPYLVWHSSKNGQNTHTQLERLDRNYANAQTVKWITRHSP